MSQPENYAEPVRRSVDALMAHYFSTNVAGELKVGAVEANTENLTLRKTWRLATQAHHRTLTGQHSGNNFGSLHECKQAVSATCQKIESGAHRGFVGALESFVTKAPVTATWEQKHNLGHHDTTYQHIHTCNTCSGHGRNTCSTCSGRGRCQCGRCHGRGRTSCSSCGGSGQTGSGQHRTFCGGCGGRGNTSCSFCFGNGQAQCNGCNGRGHNACSPCNATGYFTERYSIDVSAQGKLRVDHPANLQDWQEGYLRKATNNQVGWAGLSSACYLDPTSILRNEPAYPLAFDIKGELPFVSAKLELRSLESKALFVGESCHVYQLGNLGDAVYKPLLEGLKNPENISGVKVALTVPASNQLLGHRREPAKNGASVLRQAGIIGHDTVNSLMTQYHEARGHLSISRSTQSVKAWALKSMKFTVLALLAVALLDSVYGNTLDWENTGLHALVLWGAQLPRFLIDVSRYIWYDGIVETRGLWAGLILGVYLLTWWLMLSRRRMGKMRFLGGLFLTNIAAVMLYFLFYPIARSMTLLAPSLPEIHTLAAGLINSPILLPEALLTGLFVAMLRLRLRNDVHLRSFAREVGSKPLLEDLGYK